MELLQLKYFQEAAKTQNFSKAADNLNITQPSLSITIMHLEDELNVKLFNRKGRNIELNETGIAFLNRVNRILCEIENAKNEIKDISKIQSNHVSIATTGSALLSGVLKNYLASHEDILINQHCGMYETIVKQLKSGEIDMCLTYPAIKDKDIECTILKEDEIVLVVPNTHRFSGRDSICLSEVSEDSFITLSTTDNYRKITDTLCRSAGFSPKIAFEVDVTLMEEIIELGRGVALVPLYLVNRPHIGRRNLTMIKIKEPDTHLQIGLSWLKNGYLSNAARHFRSFIIDNYNNFIP